MNNLGHHNVALSLKEFAEFALSFPHPCPTQLLPLCWHKGLATFGHHEQLGNLPGFKTHWYILTILVYTYICLCIFARYVLNLAQCCIQLRCAGPRGGLA